MQGNGAAYLSATIGTRIERLRVENDCSQEDLGEHCGVSRASVSNWERGVHPPSLEMTEVIADYFAVPAEFVAFGIDDGAGDGAAIIESGARVYDDAL